MARSVPLEKAAEAVCDASAIPPLIFQLPPSEGRKVLDTAQDAPVFKYPTKKTTILVDTRKWGRVQLHQIVPDNIVGTPNVIYYIHGAGWVFGNLHTHDKLVCELAARTNSVVLFPEYALSPEAKYPTALEQCYAILSSLSTIANQMKWDMNMDTLTVAGDSVGGNMATALTILAKERRGPTIHKQLLYYPVTDARFDTESYNEFAVDYYLYKAAVEWSWDLYTTSAEERNQITASPLRATREQLQGLPDAMILNGEADVLRSEGEAYSRNLREAGVDVTAMRFQAIIHDFVMLNALDQTDGCRAAMDASTAWINRKNQSSLTWRVGKNYAAPDKR